MTSPAALPSYCLPGLMPCLVTVVTPAAAASPTMPPGRQVRCQCGCEPCCMSYVVSVLEQNTLELLSLDSELMQEAV